MGYKSGFVTIIGRPNVGKSTLLNRFAGEKIAIISNKPQTTRNTIRAVVTTEQSQVIFMDTPGIHRPKSKLGEYMVSSAENTLGEVDAVLFVTEAETIKPGEAENAIVSMLKNLKTPVFLIINKVDTVKKEQILILIKNYTELMEFTSIIPVSALKNDGVDEIMKEIINVLPEGPKFFPDDMLTDQPEKTIAAEIIREKILRLVSEEVPHGAGVEVISFKEREDGLISIQANIYCEKETHKGILIGKNGSMLKKIGTLARKDIEAILGTRVFLEAWVKVKPDWKNSPSMLKILGYSK